MLKSSARRWFPLILLGLWGCGEHRDTLKVAATAIPHAELLEQVQPQLESQGIHLEIVYVEDYNMPNRALAEGQIKANFFQHLPFLEAQLEEFRYPLVNMGAIEIEPMGIYSKAIKSLGDLPDGSTVAIPSDPSNEGRALLLLQQAGLLRLRDPSKLLSTPLDIAENSKHLRFVEVDAAMLPRSLSDVSFAVINTNYALQAGLHPTQDALLLESAESPYVNILVVRQGDEQDPQLKALYQALTSSSTRAFLQEHYRGAVLPAF